MRSNGTLGTIVALFAVSLMAGAESPLWQQGISIIPYPQEVRIAGEDFVLDGEIGILLTSAPVGSGPLRGGEPGGSAERARAGSPRGRVASDRRIELRGGAPARLGSQGYELQVEKNRMGSCAGGRPP